MELIYNLKCILMDNNYIQCQKAYLRGSYARGEYQIESDIDLLIISSDFISVSIIRRKEIAKKIFQDKIDNVIDCICLTEEEYNKAINEKREILLKEMMIEVL
ncbi:nucleotidyltransferase domain-containing protein [Bacillus pumilus]|uniref:nucleotidyltransferase domain-containing protein n=1 Tax=Bacillus pumilus TaxID=1408 RepID=UPI00349E6BAA